MIIRHHDLEVTLRDEWLVATETAQFVPLCSSYVTDSTSSKDPSFQIVDINEIAPTRRSPGVDYFNKSSEESLTAEERACRILLAFVNGAALPPIQVAVISNGSCRFKLKNGMHRLLLSLAVGFTHIPTVTIEDFEFEAL